MMTSTLVTGTGYLAGWTSGLERGLILGAGDGMAEAVPSPGPWIGGKQTIRKGH
ncbi:MAG TPA: hypothetical protein VKB77_15355 [Terriglobales bacterium]|nr:hypothetical protein [Terriglobales bacterium]